MISGLAIYTPKVYLHFIRPVILSDGAALFLQVIQITVAELRVTVTAVGILLGIFFPQQ